MIALQFLPWHGILGGCTLGLLSAGKTLVTGRILGISGAIKGLLKGDVSPWRFLYIGGLVSGGIVLQRILPASFDAIPSTFTIPRAIIAGLMVGSGSSLGNGCTSGHGIAGNARLSKRSMVYTGVFFVAGMVATTFTGTSQALGLAQQPPQYAPPSPQDLLFAASLFACSMGATVITGAAAKVAWVRNAYEFVSGALFSGGLAFSQMTRPTMVATALAAFQPEWNWTLMCVMGAALAVATPLFQTVIKRRTHALSGQPLAMPSSTAIDGKLVAGAILFGGGWGIGGFCPGPALTSLPTLQPQTVAVVASMVVGMAATLAIEARLKPAEKRD